MTHSFMLDIGPMAMMLRTYSKVSGVASNTKSTKTELIHHNDIKITNHLARHRGR